ncbi:major facilitator superfamily domain-containing protein [Melanogaster broomeanus]|nr:major facilitator superfamily domain-containing protein [Melanogaster broomeanus]
MSSDDSPHDATVTVHDETCPLLRDRDVEGQLPLKPKPTPLPKGQLAALCTVRLVDPIAFTQLFPYVNQFMSDLHLTDDPSRIGFYSGLVESTFAVAQLTSIYQWAQISDVVGRRPVILVGSLVIAITTAMFGLSKSLTAVLVTRAIGGFFSGNVAVIHSVLGDITDSTNQATAFPIYGITWPLGSIIGPLIGGSFSHPASKYPQVFDYEFWRDYPYFLPCLISATISIIGVLLGYAFLEETLPSKRKQRSEKFPSPASDSTQTVGPPPSLVPETPISMKELLALPIMSALSMSGFALSFLVTCFDVVFVLFCFTPVQNGGLAFSESQIGYSLAGAGAITAIIQIFIMSYLLRTFDCAKMYNFCMGLWPYAFAAFPILNAIARGGLDEETGQFGAFTAAMLWIGIAIIASLGYMLSMVLVKENVPTPASLGRSNGLVQFAMCSSRSFAPFLVSSLFAFSIENKILGGHLWVVTMVLVAYLSTMISAKISLHSKRTIP